MISTPQPCRSCGLPTKLSVVEGLTAPEGYRPLCCGCLWRKFIQWWMCQQPK